MNTAEREAVVEKLEIPVIATNHLTWAEVCDPERPGKTKRFEDWPGATMEWEYGWMIWIDEDYEVTDRYESWPGVRAVIDWAVKNGFKGWVRLDCDAESVEGLPTYDW